MTEGEKVIQRGFGGDFGGDQEVELGNSKDMIPEGTDWQRKTAERLGIVIKGNPDWLTKLNKKIREDWKDDVNDRNAPYKR